MINLFRKQNGKRKGAATLIMTVVLLAVSTLIIIFASNYSMMQEKTTANLTENTMAFAAAEAGIEFGINYLNKNSALILAGPVSGFIPPYSDSNTTNVTFTNNSKFTVVYTNPVANNLTRIKITSTGVSGTNAATKVMSQEVQKGSILFSPGNTPLVAKGAVNMSGSSTIVNLTNPSSIQSGGVVSMSGSSSTILSTGPSSSSGNIQSDIQANNSTLSSMSSSDFFSTYFGKTSNQVKSSMLNVYSNSTNTNYSSTLNGKTGTTIWIDQLAGTASISGNTTIGSAANPVLLVVNGDLKLSGNVTIYGYVFVLGTNDIDSITGNLQITGGIASTGSLLMSGSSTLSYNPTVISNLQNSPALNYYAKIPGTWKDF